jgi:hypothetical protein
MCSKFHDSYARFAELAVRGDKFLVASNPEKQKAPRGASCLLWWTRRELNPRPKAICGQDYMLSSLI